jgi:hypothetical protein
MTVVPVCFIFESGHSPIQGRHGARRDSGGALVSRLFTAALPVDFWLSDEGAPFDRALRSY